MKKNQPPAKRAALNVRVLAVGLYGELFGRRSRKGVEQAMEAFSQAGEAERAFYTAHLAYLQVLAASDVLRELRRIRVAVEDAVSQLDEEDGEEEAEEDEAAEGDASPAVQPAPVPGAGGAAGAQPAPQDEEEEVEDDIDALLVDGFDADGEE